MNKPLAYFFAFSARADVVEITENCEYPVPSAWKDDLLALIVSLTEFPAMGRARPEFQRGLRSFVLGSFLVFYRFDDTELEIVRVLHGSRNLDAIFLET